MHQLRPARRTQRHIISKYARSPFGFLPGKHFTLSSFAYVHSQGETWTLLVVKIKRLVFLYAFILINVTVTRDDIGKNYEHERRTGYHLRHLWLVDGLVT